jgi:hypothetical protein
MATLSISFAVAGAHHVLPRSASRRQDLPLGERGYRFPGPLS